MSAPVSNAASDTSARAATLSLLARAPGVRLATLLPDLPPFDWLRRPEVGAVMLRGRMGAGGGAPFNLGEMTVTRCALRLADGTVGHAAVQGRDKGHATRVAVIDALMQGEDAVRIETAVLAPLRAEEAARRRLRAEKAAATKVEFFTLVRGED
ncbi:alpha-D-ribose 1-methylphosphonate 5-triphosphate synthase subunit PhnG [Rhodobacter viridis]|uniref:Alpha-D-ribose 1-methylphosphonate 5-triphosphate synthase subunit PhnG n=1 Tax=Rhodobacter viridis TaxID=1054202 RepID=A0A318UGR2_9RHOB|nr:phosphonate C-P lyase system protein PhnG [Rhodobacter viridis]PYF12755.1 alpha-D-ribose 1-methylphosphonate 5-triphosphate synthase subunit PhnG [Rhodobacter viridis]